MCELIVRGKVGLYLCKTKLGFCKHFFLTFMFKFVLKVIFIDFRCYGQTQTQMVLQDNNRREKIALASQNIIMFFITSEDTVHCVLVEEC